MNTKFPDWFSQLSTNAVQLSNAELRWQPVPESEERTAAILILFGETELGGEVVLIQRPDYMREHAGQPAFPGGACEPDDLSPTATALRESQEETGLDPDTVTVVAELPELWLLPSRFKVTPVLAWWHSPHALQIPETGEVASVHRILISELLDPHNRVSARTKSGFIGPAFRVQNLLVWGFTGGILAKLFEVSGLALPWDPTNEVELSQVKGVEE